MASDLLGTDDKSLESTTRKIKTLYRDDFQHISETSKLPVGCGLHKFLSCVAMSLKLDSGSLESLNSMIRQGINISNNVNISLELLSARVNTRKTITTEANGSTKLRDVKPIAMRVASSCVLYQDQITDILGDTYRWTPPSESSQYSTGKPRQYDPGAAVLTKPQTWAFRFHRVLMRALVKLSKANVLIGFSLCPTDPASDKAPKFSETYIVAEHTSRICQVKTLELSGERLEDGFEAFLESPLEFLTSLDVLANMYDIASTYKPGVMWETIVIKYADRIPDCAQQQGNLLTPYEAGKIRLVVCGTGDVNVIKYRKEYTKKQQDLAPATTADPGDTHGGGHGHAGNVEGGATAATAILDKQSETDADGVESEDSLDSFQATEEIDLLMHELQGDYSDDDGDHVAKNDNEQQTNADPTASTDANVQNTNGDDDDSDKDHILSPGENTDLHDMQDSNDRLLAAAANLQEQTAFCDVQSFEIPDGVRPYDDEIGEALFTKYINKEQEANPPSAKRTKQHNRAAAVLTSAVLQVAFDKWTTSAQLSAKACEEISSRCTSFDVHNVGACLGHELSLVLHDGPNDTVVSSLVTWVTPYTKLRGRPVRLDEDDCVIYPSHFTDKREFSNAVMIWPTTGARVRKQAREKVSDQVLRIRTMVETSIDGLVGVPTDFEPSRVCSACHHHGNMEDDLYRCSFCLLWWHHDCAQQLAERLPSFMQTHGSQRLDLYDLTMNNMPFFFWWLVLKC